MSLPLSGRTVLVTRSREQTSSLASELARLGAEPILIPTIAIAPPSSSAALEYAARTASGFDWIIFTSANAVTAFAAAAHILEDGRILPPIASIGPSTTAALVAAGLLTAGAHPFTPPRAVAESLAAMLVPRVQTLLAQQGSARILLLRAEQAPDLLPDTLRQHGAEVTVAPAYRTILPETSLPKLQALFSDPGRWPHAITFTSSSTARNLASLLEAADLHLPPGIPRVSIGPVTSQTLRELTLPPHAEALNATVSALAAAVVQVLTAP